MMRPNLRLLVPSILALTAASALPGCASETSMDETAPCPGKTDDRYQSLTLGPGIDGIEFRVQLTGTAPKPAGTTETSFRKRKALGEVCKTATDKNKCMTQVAQLTSKDGWASIGAYSGPSYAGPDELDYGVGTRGDEVFLITTAAALAKAVSPIDTSAEAVALVRLAYSEGTVCAEENVTKNANGFVVKSLGGGSCGGKSETLFTVSHAGNVQGQSRILSSGDSNCYEGRRPAGFAETGEPAGEWLASLAGHFSEIAYMEAAAVLAFDELERNLRALDAPEELIERTRKARADEVRHTDATRSLASRFGGALRDPIHAAASRSPGLLEFAIENAREGCIRETYGALVAGYQAMHAADEAVRAVFSVIRDEELEHAELSWSIAEWAESKLTPLGQSIVQSARERALVELRASVGREPCEEVRIRAGMPDAATALQLLDGIEPALRVAA